jgi:hypothetical protein
MKKCSVEGCDGKHCGLGFCKKHYNQYKKYGRIMDEEYKNKPKKTCSVEGCNGKHEAKGFCNKHYLQYKKNALY